MQYKCEYKHKYTRLQSAYIVYAHMPHSATL